MYDDEDPVVDEFPVFLCRELEDKLFIFQYPVQPASSANELHVIKSQIKPENQEVVLEVALDTASPNYDKSHGEQIALSIDKDKNASNKTFPMKIVDRMRLESKKTEGDVDSYAVGTMVHGALVLTPVKGVVSLSPNLNPLVGISVDDTDGGEMSGGEEEAKLVRVQFSKVETEKSKKLREQSYSYYCQKSAEEPWYKTEYYTSDTPLSQVERQKLASALSKGTTQLSSGDYLDRLTNNPNMTSRSQDKDYLAKRITELLTRVKALSTSMAADMLKISEAEVLPFLQASGVLVQGVWVLRSDLKFDGAHYSVPQEQLIRARDYILFQFWEGKCIERARLNELVRLPPDILYEAISEVGKLNSSKAWVFSHLPDRKFMARYPDIVEQQGLLWEARASQILEGLGSRRRRRDSGRRARGNSLSEDDSETTKRGRKKSECEVKPDIASLTGIKT